MRFRLLGPIDVVDGDRAVGIGGGRQRALLAALLLRPNEPVSTDRLIEDLWGERRPATAATALHGLVSSLRKALEPDRDPAATPSILVTRAPGYMLCVDGADIDAMEFERLLESGRRALAAGGATEAAELLRGALALWRGPALAEVAERGFARVEAHRLEELRLEALEDRIEADLLDGRAETVVTELEALVAREPLRERPCGLLMRALYATGRQAEALGVYRSARRRLVDELGIEPSRRLQELEQAILRQDPALGEAGEPLRLLRRRSARRRRLPLALVAVAAVGAAAALIGAFGVDRGAPPALAGVDADHLGIVDPRSNTIVGEIAVGSRPAAVVLGHGSVWVANAGDGTVMRIDPRTRRVVRIVGIGAPASSLAVTADAVWVGNGSAGTVSQIDATSSTLLQTVDLRGPHPAAPNRIRSIAAGEGGLWVAAGPWVVRLDPSKGDIVRRIDVGSAPLAVGVGAGAVWVATSAERLIRIEPSSNRVTASEPIRDPMAVSVGLGKVWVMDHELTAFDATTVTRAGGVPAGFVPIAVATGFGSVWSLDESAGTLYRTDPTDLQYRKIVLGNHPADVAAGAGEVWISVQSR